MKMRKILLAALASAVSVVSAQPAGSRPQAQNQSGVNYLCGGVGAEEAAYMKERARQYGLMLTFATRDGSYLADVDVDIRDAQGEPVLHANCDGPIMLVELPVTGTYRVHAEAGGEVLDRKVHVVAGSARPRTIRMAMVWPNAIGESATATGSGDNRSRGASGYPAGK